MVGVGSVGAWQWQCFDSQDAFLNFEEDRHQQGGGHLTVREEAEVDCTSSGLADPLFLLALPVK